MALAAFALIFAAIRAGGALLEGREAQKRFDAVSAALEEADMSRAAVTFTVPYGSSAFSPENIAAGSCDDADIAAIEAFVGSLTPDKEATSALPQSGCTISSVVSVSLPTEGGRAIIAAGSGELCYVQLSRDDRWTTAAYRFDEEARSGLLALGGLPPMDEMMEAIGQRFNELHTEESVEPVLK